MSWLSWVAMVLLPAAVLVPVRPAPATEGAPGEDRVRVLLPNFRTLAGGAGLEGLGQGIAGALYLALLQHPWIDPVIAEAGEERRPGAREPVFQGEYAEFRRGLRLSGSLRGPGDSVIRVNPMVVDRGRILDGIRMFAREVAAALGRTRGVDLPAIMVACFDDRSEPSRRSEAVIRDLGEVMSERLQARETVRVVTAGADQPCVPRVRAAEALSQGRARAAIGGTVRIVRDDVRVFPELAIVLPRGNTRDVQRILIPSIRGRLSDYLRLRQEVGQAITDFLDGVLGARGEWDISILAGRMSVDDSLRIGKELLDGGKTSQAVILLRRVLDREARPEGHLNMGTARLRQGRLEEALDHFAAVGDVAAGKQGLARALVGKRRYREAIEAYQRALQLDPSLGGVELELGDVYALRGQAGDAERARLHYEGASGKEPGNPRPYERLAALIAQEPSAAAADEAIALYARALAADHTYEPARWGLAGLHARKAERAQSQRRFEEAERELTEALAQAPQPRAEYLFHRAMARARLLEAHAGAAAYQGTIDDYLAAIRLAPASPGSSLAPLGRWAALGLTEIYVLAGLYSDARAEAERLLEEEGLSRAHRVVVRFLAVAARILAGEEHEAELAVLRREWQGLGERGTLGGWQFDLLETRLRSDPALDADRRDLVLQLSQELVKKASPPP